MPKYVTISVSPKAKIIIERLAKKYELTIIDFTESMVKYFDKTGVNPRDIQVLSVAEELKKFRDTIISFLRTQEKDFILPTFGKMDSIIARFAKYIEEEAPKRGEQERVKPLSLSLGSEVPSAKEDGSELPLNTDKVYEEKYIKLQNDYNNLIQKHETVLSYFQEILDKTENRQTGLNRAPVINLPMATINDYKQFLKRLG